MTHSVRHAVASAIVAAALMPGLAVRADEFRLLDGKQIRARMVGKDITDGPHWTMYLRPDGALVSSEAGSSWTGKWEIRNDRLCISSPGSTALECNQVWVSGTNVRMRANKDQNALEGMVAVHRNN